MFRPPAERLYPTNSINTHARLQMRGETNHAIVQHYKKVMQSGEAFLAITLAEIGGKLYVVDGHHRLEAANAAGLPTILGTHRRMSLDDAHREALLANNKHGYSLTTKQKKHAFASYITEKLHLTPAGKVKPLDAIAQDCPFYSRGHLWKLLKALNIEAPREERAPYRPTYGDEPSPEDLKTEDAILLGEFRKHLDAATASYSLMTDTSRSAALTSLKALTDALTPPPGYLDI